MSIKDILDEINEDLEDSGAALLDEDQLYYVELALKRFALAAIHDKTIQEELMKKNPN